MCVNGNHSLGPFSFAPLQICEEYGLTAAERGKILDYLHCRKDAMYERKPLKKKLEIPKRPQAKYLELLR